MNKSKALKTIPFSHKNHVTLYGAAECTTCHGYTELGRFTGIPTAGGCRTCHSAGSTASDEKVTAMLKKYGDGDRPWESHAEEPDNVYFSHSVVMTARFSDGRHKARCGDCHGNKAASENGEMIRGRIQMNRCRECHTALRLSNKCMVCHH